MSVKINLSTVQANELLYFETGFEQLHPLLEIHAWMAEHGWEYHRDWKCVKVPHTFDQRSYYQLCFESEQAATMFTLKWLK